MDRHIGIEQVGFSNIDFWNFYFHVNYPNGYDDDFEMTLGEMVEEILPFNMEWVNIFTQYYDGVLEELDGYLETPTTLIATLNINEVLKIEFHPGDIIFFINEKRIGSTGPHYMTQAITYQKLEKVLTYANGDVLFLLLLPMAIIEELYLENATKTIVQLLQRIFPHDSCTRLANCIMTGFL